MTSVAIVERYRNRNAPDEIGHALDRVRAAPVVADPFAHFLARDFLTPTLFSALRDAFPEPPDGMHSVQWRRRDPDYSDKRFSQVLPNVSDPASEALPAPIRTLQRLLTCDRMVMSLLDAFAADVAPRLRAFDAVIGRGHVPLATTIELIHDRSGFALVPHTDGSKKLVTGLLYVADPDDPPELGTRLYAPTDPELTSDGALPTTWEQMTEAGMAPYLPNLFLCFARTDRSFHGVEATTSDRPRRLVQYAIHLA